MSASASISGFGAVPCASAFSLSGARPKAPSSMDTGNHGADGMNIHSWWTDHPDDEMRVYREYARQLEDREMARGCKLPEARAAVANRAGVPPGSLENLRRGRLKDLTTFLKKKIRAALIRELEQEAARLDHQLTILRATGVDPRENVVAQAEAHLRAARTALNSAID